ncbi:MAG: GntR family transcriptional regulator [Desulfobacterales bacterium]|nr:GntR family transcriptional regulator [Desulfobacterales bacterium]
MKDSFESKNSGKSLLRAIPARKLVGEHVFEYLKKTVVRGEFPPGARLVENIIAQALNVSRTPVREAIHKLEKEGLLEKQTRGGFIIRELTREEIEETFGIRSVLEGYAARIAAQKCSGKALVPLEKTIDEFQEKLDQGLLEELPGINTRFHDLLYNLSKSPRLVSMINGLGDRIFRFRRIILKKKELARISNEDHRAMISLMRSNRPDDVEKLVREHILRGQAAVLKDFDGAED